MAHVVQADTLIFSEMSRQGNDGERIIIGLNPDVHYGCHAVAYRLPSGKVSVDPGYHLFCFHLPHPHMVAAHEQPQVKHTIIQFCSNMFPIVI